VRFLEVLRERVVTEVLLQVAPGGVHVVRVVLRVVQFDEERRTLDAVVVALAHFGAAGPSEEDLVLGKLGDFDDFLGGEVIARPADKFIDDETEEFFLLRVEGGEGDALVLQETVGLLLVAGDDVGGYFTREDRDLALFGGEGSRQLTAEAIFLVEEFEVDEARVVRADVLRGFF